MNEDTVEDDGLAAPVRVLLEAKRAATHQRKLEREAAVLKLLHDDIEASRQEVAVRSCGRWWRRRISCC